MARPRTVPGKELIKKLKEHTQRMFGKPLTHSFECEVLSQEVARITQQYISPQTLRRFFGFLESDFSPSIKTLNALSAYVGYDNWYSFSQLAINRGYAPLKLEQEYDLYLDFYKIDMREEADMNYHNASRNIAYRILFNPALLAKLAPELARNPVSQVYFFERFPYIDGLATAYTDALKLYLRKKDVQAQIFGMALLYLGAWLTGNTAAQKHYIHRLRRYPLDESYHPFIVARYIGSNLLYEQSMHRDLQDCIRQAREWNEFFKQKPTIRFWKFPHYQFMMGDYLNLAGLFEESHGILRTIPPGKNYHIEKGYEEALEVVWEISRHSRHPEAYVQWFETTGVFDTINLLFKKFYRLQALKVYASLVKGRKKLKAEKEILQLNERLKWTLRS